MATNNNANRITLKIGVVFNETDALKQARKLQGSLDKQSDAMNKKREKGINAVTNAQKKNNDAIKDGSKATKSLGKNFADAFKKAVKGFVVLQLLLAITTQIRRAVTLAFELDKAFTNLSIVSKASASEIAQVDVEVGNLTKRLGALKAEVVNTVTEFSRAGFTIQESMQLASVAITGANVGMTSLEEVTTFLVAGLKAFRLEAEESTRILDVLFRVANTTAIDLSGIGEAFLRSANTLNTAGASLEQSAALISAANESIQNPSKIGSAINTLVSRIRGVGVEGEAIPKLAEDLRAVGVELETADGGFRNIFDVLQDFSKIYDDLDEITRESLLEKMAGKRQKNVLIGLLTNFETAEQAVIDAENSAGEAARAQEKFLQSLEGQSKLLRDAWNSLLETLKKSGALEVVIKFLTGFANALTFIVQKIPLVITGVSGLATAFVVSSVKISGATAVMTGGLSVLVGLLAAVAQGFVIYNSVTETSAEKLNKYNTELSTLRATLEQLNRVENPTEAQQERIDLIKERINLTNTLIAREEKLRSVERAEQIAGIRGSLVEETFLGTSLIGLKKKVDDLQLLKLEILETNESLASNTQAYKMNAMQLEVVDGLIEDTLNLVREKGGVVDDYINTQDEENEKTEEQINLYKQTIALASQTSDEYRLLSDALDALTNDGFLTTEMLDELVKEFPDLITQTGLAEDAFVEYITSNINMRQDEIQSLKTQLEAEQRTATALIENWRTLAEARRALFVDVNGVEVSVFGEAIKEQETIITNTTNAIGILDNLLVELGGKRKEDTSSSSKQTKVLTALERALNEVNFQIELQQKLLSRTDIPSEQIKINETLIDLYKQQKQVLMEQQEELESQRSQVVKGTEAYDEFIEKSYDLSLAIEDSTNNIYALEQANRELNKTFQETKIGELEESLSSLSESIKGTIDEEIAKVKELAEAEADRFKSLIESKKAELQALKDANQEKEDQIKLEQLLLNLQDLRERRQNILNNKNVRIVRDADVGFENIADPREVRAINEQIIDAEKAIADFRREQVFNEEVKKLELTIEGLEKQAEAEQESYNERVRVLEEFKNDTDELVENSAQIQRGIVVNLANDLENIEKGSYSSRLESLSSFISQYNAKLSQLNAQKSRVEAIEQSIRNTQQNIQGLQSTPSSSLQSSTSTISNTPSTGSLANNISSNNTNTTNSSTSIGSININTNANSLDNLIKDARRQTPLLSKN